MSAKELIKKLLSFPGRGARTFEAFRRLDLFLGEPHRSFRSVHVGGTNGKGSVCVKIAEGLRKEGYRVGLYTSPHISSVRERILVDGEMISLSSIEEHLPKILAHAGEDVSFFDLLTALAFLHFRASKVDWAVVEVGLGGRFDATNVLNSSLSVITSIGYDHMELLGSSLELIAFEKGGIIREGIPLITGPSAAPFFPFSEVADSSLSPFYDEENSLVAQKALQRLGVSETAIAAAIQARPRCRFEQIGDTILDAAHNQDGFKRLALALKYHFPNEKFHVIAGFSPGKEWKESLKQIEPVAKNIRLVCSHPRLLPLGVASLEEELKFKGCRKVVCGSFYLMSEARRLLGICDPMDPE